MSLSALRSVGDAIDATRSFMLPVSVREWAVLAAVVLFMGTPGTPVPANPQFFDPNLWRGPRQTVGGEGLIDGDLVDVLGFEVFEPTTWPGWLVALLVGLVVLWIAYQVLGVLLRFVLVEALARDETRLVADSRANAGNAGRIVAFRLGVALVATPVVLLLLLAVTPGGPVSVGGWAAGTVGALAAGIGVLAWLVDAVTLQFVVPTMLRTGDGVLGAWRRFGSVLVAEWREYVAFALVRIALGVGVGIGAAVAVGVALLLGVVVVGTIGAIVVVAAGGLNGLGGLGAAALGVLTLLFLVYAIAAYGAVAVPFQVYLWTYALFVLGDTDSELDLIPEFREAARSDDGRFVGA